jgi:hypothetical protein
MKLWADACSYVAVACRHEHCQAWLNSVGKLGGREAQHLKCCPMRLGAKGRAPNILSQIPSQLPSQPDARTACLHIRNTAYKLTPISGSVICRGRLSAHGETVAMRPFP